MGGRRMRINESASDRVFNTVNTVEAGIGIIQGE